MVENVIDWINLYLVNGAISFPEFICWIVIVRWKALPAFEQLGPELTSKIFQVANNSRRLNLSLEIKSIVIGSILLLQRTVRELSLLGIHGVVLLLMTTSRTTVPFYNPLYHVLEKLMTRTLEPCA